MIRAMGILVKSDLRDRKLLVWNTIGLAVAVLMVSLLEILFRGSASIAHLRMDLLITAIAMVVVHEVFIPLVYRFRQYRMNGLIGYLVGEEGFLKYILSYATNRGAITILFSGTLSLGLMGDGNIAELAAINVLAVAVFGLMGTYIGLKSDVRDGSRKNVYILYALMVVSLIIGILFQESSVTLHYLLLTSPLMVIWNCFNYAVRDMSGELIESTVALVVHIAVWYGLCSRAVKKLD